MRMLFEIDKKDYIRNGSAFSRPSARAIIIKAGKIAMVHSKKYNYYKLPGGGIEADEGFTLEFVALQLAIHTNRTNLLDDFNQVMLEREARVLELLIQEGYFESGLINKTAL